MFLRPKAFSIVGIELLSDGNLETASSSNLDLETVSSDSLNFEIELQTSGPRHF